MPEITPTALLRLPETFARFWNERWSASPAHGRADCHREWSGITSPRPEVTPSNRYRHSDGHKDDGDQNRTKREAKQLPSPNKELGILNAREPDFQPEGVERV